MIIDEIVLHNIGPFKGRHTAVLTPLSPQKPIILFGGLNGAGKTTLLEAMQLALYGKHAATGRRAGLSYDDYLRRLMNRDVHPRDGAAVELYLRVNEQGITQRLRIRRSWRASDVRVTESLEVFIDDAFDLAASEAWGERVSRFIPPQLSTLFFFDGERIEALADPERSSEVLMTTINALLGVDLVEQLQVDLLALERRKLGERKSEPERERIAETERQMRDLESKLQDKAQELAQLQSQIGQLQGKREKVDQEFIRQGGTLAENQHVLENQHKHVQAQIIRIQSELAVLAGQDLPLRLIPRLLSAVRKQASHEAEADRHALIQTAIEERDRRIIKQLGRRLRNSDLLQEFETLLEGDRKKLSSGAKIESYLQLPSVARLRLEMLCDQALERQRQRATELLLELEGREGELESLERRLAAVPDSEAIAKLVKERELVRSKLAEHQVRHQVAAEQKGELEHQHATLKQNLDALARDNAASQLESDDAGRFLRHSEKARHTLEKFRVTITERHTRRLEQLILEGFRQLLRKQSLVDQVRIDPKTCVLGILDGQGNLLPPERLSAGERQLLAVSILWGLARASGRPLPVVVDTPLGRLDASHRTHLIQRYFPFASHQVLLLSTDEEIDKEYLAMLSPHVGRSYRLVFDEIEKVTNIENGYFWQETAVC